jgi:hypothetical protein
MTFAVSLVIGAALLAAWFDVRFDRRRPVSLVRRAIHAAIALAVLRTATAGAHYLIVEDASAVRRVILISVLFLPSLVYAFLAVCWLLRTLGDVAATARR